MGKIVLYIICFHLLGLTACNNDRETNSGETGSDSLKRTSQSDSMGHKVSIASKEMIAFFASPSPDFDPGATIKRLSLYPDLDDKTKSVKFDYDLFNLFIDSLNDIYGNAKEIYLAYGAYTENDVKRYLANHVTEPPIKPDAILNMPCLLVAYKDPKTDKFIYKDFGTICPPPNSCESNFMYPDRRAFIGTTEAGFDPAATINNYEKIYDTDADPICELTKMVKFDITGMKYIVDSLDKKNGITTKDIYFVMAAYTKNDALRYIITHPTIKKSEINHRTCLLFEYKNPKAAEFIYFDFGSICPPPNSCESSFFYGK